MILATVANMRKYQRADKVIQTPDGPITIHARQPFTYSPNTDERYSATPGDYWNMPEDEPLRDEDGEPMILVFESVSLIDADEY